MRIIRFRQRAAFTLIEMLVALALVLFIMSILGYAFDAALSTFGKLKATGDLAANLRSATTILQQDLAANHFEASKRLSDADFWTDGPPEAGFFRIWQGSRSGSGVNVYEGNDLSDVPSFRSVDHMLHFTVTHSGNQRQDFLSAVVPPGSPLLSRRSPELGPWEARYQDSPGTFNSPWAEVAYFLRRSPDDAGGTPLYNLHRRQWLAVSNNVHVAPSVPLRQAFDTAASTRNFLYLEMSARPGGPGPNEWLYFNNLNDLSMPIYRGGMNRADPAGMPQTIDPVTRLPSYPLMGDEAPTLGGRRFQNADLLLTDVISFDVRVLLAGNSDFADLFDPSIQAYSGNNPAFPRNGSGPQVLDTWSSRNDGIHDYSAWSPLTHAVSRATIPLYFDPRTGRTIRVRAIQITLRIWDIKTQQTRQTTLVQAM
jgi:prepilin-type N-terminal cleavage/methylation domain-containing protein